MLNVDGEQSVPSLPARKINRLAFAVCPQELPRQRPYLAEIPCEDNRPVCLPLCRKKRLRHYPVILIVPIIHRLRRPDPVSI
ncbi:hypothetical protein KCP76_05525 [Salmonella enterica subsp. enterica serovar Weltevreden]|nr:hypothetical protein KCP76_05525 [Salmonella enterica subsp. enterica serovar Weltevreden]